MTYSFNEVYSHYKSITQFAVKSYELLTNAESAEQFSMQQFNQISSERNSENQIHILEDICTKISESN